jgi:hypothetical protein
MEENENKNNQMPIWRIILSIIIFGFTMFRLMDRCSKTKQNTGYNNSELNEITSQYTSPPMLAENENNVKSNTVLYMPFKQLEALSDEEKRKNGLLKILKDTLVSIEPGLQVKIEKGCYFQNNHDVSMRFAFKDKLGLITFIHKVDCEDDNKNCFLGLKANEELTNLKIDKSQETMPMYSYSIKYDAKKFNGSALTFKEAKGFYIEFESQDISPKILKLLAMQFHLTSLIINGKSIMESIK